MTKIKDYYRYYVIVDLNGKPTVKKDEIPLKIREFTNGSLEITGYAEIPTDYGFTPRADHIGRITEGYLWLEEDNMEKARDLFVKQRRNDIQESLAQIDKLKAQIETDYNYVKNLENIVYQVKNFSVDPEVLYHYDEEERDGGIGYEICSDWN